jgi:hypothetical protein
MHLAHNAHVKQGERLKFLRGSCYQIFHGQWERMGTRGGGGGGEGGKHGPSVKCDPGRNGMQ